MRPLPALACRRSVVRAAACAALAAVAWSGSSAATASRATTASSASAAARPPAPAAPAAQDAAAGVELGRYLARVGDCAACHTAAGGKPYAGGRALDTGFGVIYSPNITPDRETGIGTWSEQDFYRALHTGHDDEGKHLYPAFPYPWFTKVSRSDVDAIKAYLDTLAPVRQENKPPALDWWLSWRPLVAGWNLLNFQAGTFVPDPHKSARWNRGAYLVEGLGHCGDCHTPKRFFGGTIDAQALGGGRTRGGGDQGWYAPSLAGEHRAGLGDWSEAEIVQYLKTGFTARTASAGPMSEVVRNSTRYYSDADLAAVAAYLKDLPPRHPEKASGALGRPVLERAALERGQGLFTDHCAACHMHDGAGLAGIFPALTGSSAIQARSPATVVRIVLEGASVPPAPGQHGHIAMPAFGWKLDDAEVADVVSYIRNAWGNRAAPVDVDTVAKARAALDHARQ